MAIMSVTAEMMTADDVRRIMREEHICVVVPTYNNGGTIVDVVRRILPFTHDVIVVNDGSTDDTHQKLMAAFPDIILVEYERNRGKGNALRVGFKEAATRGFKHVITIDSDGQHLPEDIPVFISEHMHRKDALLVGARTLNPDNMRRGSSFANNFSNFWFNMQTGLSLEDTQSGYRMYPISRMKSRWILSSRYESELELLVFAAWHGIGVVNIPIRVYYPPKAERVSHFRPFADFMRITALNLALTTMAVFYYIPRRMIRRLMR